MKESYGKAGLARNLLRAALAVDGFVLFVALCAATNNNGGLAWLLLLSMAVITGLALRYATKQGYWFVRRIERTWKHTCAGLGGSFVGEGNDYLASVREGVRSGGRYYVATQTKVIYPQLKNVRGNDQAWTAEVRFFDGQTIEQYNAHADAYALAYSVPFFSFDLDEESGLIRIRAGRMQVPEPYSYGVSAVNRVNSGSGTTHSNDYRGGGLLAATGAVSPQAVFEQSEAEARARLKGVPVAMDNYNRECRIPIEEQHWFIAGRSGSGKGSWIWALVCGLAPAWRAGIVRFWAIDPKWTELAIEPGWWHRYADDDGASVNLLEECVSDMKTRARLLQGKARKFTPSSETPLNVIVIDEVGYLVAYMPDKKLKERAINAISSLLVMGRSNGYAVVAAVQDPRKETVGFRDQFQIRVALGMQAQMVDLVLGEGMKDSAPCEQIPLGPAGQGVGYAISETSLRPVCLRPALYSDEAIRAVLAGAVVRPLSQAHEVQDGHVVPQLGFNNPPLGQFRFRVE